MTYVFECLSCGATTDPAERPADCPRCGGPLEVAYDDLPDALPENDRTDLRRYADWLPVPGDSAADASQPDASADAPVPMGEGWTPLVETPRLGATAAAEFEDASPDLYLKNETTNPTWSWKDRLAAVVVPRLVSHGADRIAAASTGNHASAVAAYASRAGVERVLAFLSPSSEPPHHRQIRAYGAEALRLTDYGERKTLLADLADSGWVVAYDLDGEFTGQPYVYEGYKTIAYELVEQLGEVPDAVVVPVGAGDGLYGIWKGFRELAARGVVADKPRMISAESEERHPLAAAFEADAESVGRDDGPEPLSTSTMGTTSGDHALGAVRASGGAAYAADREAVEEAVRTVGREGVFLEPASALAPAVVSQAVEDGVVGEADSVVVVGTGAGVAWPEKTASAVGESPTVEPTASAVADAVPFDT
ncbi:pyridoxal-phosphate dependent enzyme [Halorussus gelatinilyticus]|uniref:Pyridoxal-phosphate dependent enzyme n=1 Tax=Halorussus gelatinilyticus TaxID=2937524 RepID=A0A8U0ILB0_9EURY|nr:pyridoxal-phosphate dependent enzyme [Halorussus gelatinilyticus]UPW01466.1 pyridoxal-phosphate dependent enzyme [Halorussus gelatinilyticus]